MLGLSIGVEVDERFATLVGKPSSWAFSIPFSDQSIIPLPASAPASTMRTDPSCAVASRTTNPSASQRSGSSATVISAIVAMRSAGREVS